MIHLLHDFRYWTDALAPALDPARFALLRSGRADASHPAPRYDPRDPGQRELLLAGHAEERFAPGARVLLRLQHSPGFGCDAFLHGYRWAHAAGHRFMLPEGVLALLRTTQRLAPNQLGLRDQLLADPRLSTTAVDPALNRIFRAPRAAARVPGTLLAALNWRVTASESDLRRALEVLLPLAARLEVRLVAHPFSAARWIGSRHHPQLAAACAGAGIPLRADLTRDELIAEYDRAEFILSDGSGSLYEAMARGCKALLLDGLGYQRGWKIFAAALDAGLLPATLAADFARHPGAAHDLAWLRRIFPRSICDEDVSAEVNREIVDAFTGW